MRTFRNFILEHPSYNHAENPSNGYLSDAVIKKLNSLMGAIIKEDQQDAEIAIRQIRTSLSKIGLTFGQVPPMMEESGDFSLPLTLFGGRFGKDIDTPHNEFLEDDGISNQVEGGLSLNISYEMTETNQCRLRANIG